MRRFRNILVPVGRDSASESVLEPAARLAGRDGSSITLVAAVEYLPWYARLGLSSADLQGLLVRQSEEALERLAGLLRHRGIEASTRVLRGRPHVETVREAVRGGYDLVLKEAGPNAGESFNPGDMHLLRNGPCPVLLLRPGRGDGPFRRVLVPVDPPPPPDAAASLNLGAELDPKDPALDAKLLEVADSIAGDEAEVHVLHAWSVPGESLLRGNPMLTREQVDAYIESIRLEAHAALDRLLAAHPDRHPAHLVRGEPADVIVEFAGREHIDLIVMGTVARTGLPELLMGNTAETVLQRVGCSVLAVKPDGFVSPVGTGD
jgi:universal stress protein E